MPTRADLAKIHIAKKELGMTDEEYCDILRERFGKESAKDLTGGQTFRLLSYFRQKGWKPKWRHGILPGATIPADGQSRKILALWITLAKAGVIRNQSTHALLSFVKRMTSVDNLEWCTAAQKSAVIEALRAMAERGGVGAHRPRKIK